MSHALPLPPRPKLRHYQKRAKDLVATRNSAGAACTLVQALLAVAREHGFASWRMFARHLEALASAGSLVSAFEAAVDAIVAGDLAKLGKLLRQHPELVRARSTREHRSTLLHYVSANGVEDCAEAARRSM